MENKGITEFLSEDQLKQIVAESKGETLLDTISLRELSDNIKEELAGFQINWDAPGLLLYIIEDDILKLEVISAEGEDSYSITSSLCLGGEDANAIQPISNLTAIEASAMATSWVNTVNNAYVAYSNYYFYCRVTSLYQVVSSFSYFKPYKSEVWFNYANSSAATITSIRATTMVRGQLIDSGNNIISGDYTWSTFSNESTVSPGTIYTRFNYVIVDANESIRTGATSPSGTSCKFMFYRSGAWDQAQVTTFTI